MIQKAHLEKYVYILILSAKLSFTILFHAQTKISPLTLHFILLPLQRLKRTLKEGVTPAFGGVIHLVNNTFNQGTLPVFEADQIQKTTHHLKLEIENEIKGGTAAMKKSASEIPFLADDEFA